jgi:hypothetical protein
MNPRPLRRRFSAMLRLRHRALMHLDPGVGEFGGMGGGAPSGPGTAAPGFGPGTPAPGNAGPGAAPAGGGGPVPAPAPSPSAAGGYQQGAIPSGQVQPPYPGQPAQIVQPGMGGVPPMGGVPGQPAPQPGPQGPPPQPTEGAGEWQSISQALAAAVPGTNFKDDHEAWQAVLSAFQGARQRNYYQDVGQQVAGDYQNYLAWRQQQQGQQQQAQAQADNPYGRPEWNESWLNYVERDEASGLIRSKQGYDPAIGTKVQNYVEWRRNFREKLENDPGAVLQPLIQRQAQELVQREIGGIREQMQARTLLDQNADWLFQRDGYGRFQVNPQDGKRIYSQNGVQYFQHVRDAATRLGIGNMQAQHQYAMSQLELASLRGFAQQVRASQYNPQAQAIQPAYPAQSQPVAPQPAWGQGVPTQPPYGGQPYGGPPPGMPPGAGHYPNVGAARASYDPASPQPQHMEPSPGPSLYEMMMQDMRAANESDQTVMADLRGYGRSAY